MSDETEKPDVEEEPDPGLMKRMAKFLRMKREEALQYAADALPDSLFPHEAMKQKKKQQDELTKDNT